MASLISIASSALASSTRADESADIGKWKGPRIKIRLTADKTEVMSSSDVICRDEFKGSLFRELVERWMTKHWKKDGSAEGDTKIEDATDMLDDQMIDLWFDRNSKYKLNEHRKLLITADCEFYKLPTVRAKLFPFEARIDEKRMFDVTKMNAGSFMVIESSNLVRKTGDNAKWQCVGINHPFSIGTHSIQLKIKKTAHNYQIVGVIPVNEFAVDGYFSAPLKGVGYYVYNGYIHGAGTNGPFAEGSKVGDKIGITVSMNDDKSVAKITFLKNDRELGTKDLSHYCSLDGPLIFAVNMHTVNDEIQII